MSENIMMPKQAVVVDYGLGNLYSVASAIENCGGNAIFAKTPEKIKQASKIILPGVGAFGKAVECLKKLGLIEQIIDSSKQGVPILGICLGMQLLFEQSEEFGHSSGLGLIPGRVVQIPQKRVDGSNLKLPHIGWSKIAPLFESKERGYKLLANTKEHDSFYFLHSFMVQPAKQGLCVAFAEYEQISIPAYVESDNIFGCQFHPEKSGKSGLKIIEQFLSL